MASRRSRPQSASAPPTFPNFLRLPAELRQQIWEEALTSEWSVVTFEHYKGRKLRSVGINARSTPAVGHVNYEARVVMSRVCTKVHTTWSTARGASGDQFIGWFYMPRTLFYFQELAGKRYHTSDLHASSTKPISEILHPIARLTQKAEHVALYGSGHDQLAWMVFKLQGACQNIKTVTAISRWTNAFYHVDEYVLFNAKNGLGEINWKPLLYELEQPRDLAAVQNPSHHYAQLRLWPPPPRWGAGRRLKKEWFTQWSQMPAGSPAPVLFLRTPHQINPRCSRDRREQEWENGGIYPSWVHGVDPPAGLPAPESADQ